MLDKIPKNLYDTVWIDLYNDPSKYDTHCSWSAQGFDLNCQLVYELVRNLRFPYNKTSGIYTAQDQYQRMMNSVTGCQSLQYQQQAKLWYVTNNNDTSFNDYRQIGGWSHPDIKQFQANKTQCGIAVDLSYSS